MKILILCIFTLCASRAFADFGFMLESGAVWQHRNDIKIPGDTGTRVEFDEFDQGPFLHYRGELFWNFNKSHNLRAVFAPFNVAVKGPIPTDVNFNDQLFSSSEELEIDYTFNSYRLTYFYSFWGTGDKQFNLGFTGKIRQAATEFKQSNLKTEYDNVGFVPLFYVEYQTPLSTNWLFNFNMDAAAAPQGRAFDLALKFRRSLSKSFSLGFGLRSLEGGADNDKAFTFSWFNYGVLELVGRF